jgi:hypothetical protein
MPEVKIYENNYIRIFIVSFFIKKKEFIFEMALLSIIKNSVFKNSYLISQMY